MESEQLQRAIEAILFAAGDVVVPPAEIPAVATPEVGHD